MLRAKLFGTKVNDALALDNEINKVYQNKKKEIRLKHVEVSDANISHNKNLSSPEYQVKKHLSRNKAPQKEVYYQINSNIKINNIIDNTLKANKTEDKNTLKSFYKNDRNKNAPKYRSVEVNTDRAGEDCVYVVTNEDKEISPKKLSTKFEIKELLPKIENKNIVEVESKKEDVDINNKKVLISKKGGYNRRNNSEIINKIFNMNVKMPMGFISNSQHINENNISGIIKAIKGPDFSKQLNRPSSKSKDTKFKNYKKNICQFVGEEHTTNRDIINSYNDLIFAKFDLQDENAENNGLMKFENKLSNFNRNMSELGFIKRK